MRIRSVRTKRACHTVTSTQTRPPAAASACPGPTVGARVVGMVPGGAWAELVVLGMDGVTFLGTSGLAVLIEVREAAHSAGVELRLPVGHGRHAVPPDDLASPVTP